MDKGYDQKCGAGVLFVELFEEELDIHCHYQNNLVVARDLFKCINSLVSLNLSFPLLSWLLRPVRGAT